MWLKVGDENTRYFHNYGNKRRLTNSIWEAMDDQDNLVYDMGSIKSMEKIILLICIMIQNLPIPVIGCLSLSYFLPSLPMRIVRLLGDRSL